MTVELAPLSGTLAPFQGAVTSEVTTRVSCALAAQSPQTGLAVTYAVTTKPAGVLAIVLPPQDVADAKACDQGFVVLKAQLSMTVSAAVAAFQDAEAIVEAKVAPPSGPQSATATAKAPVAYYGGVQMSAPEKLKEVKPGDAGTFLVTVRNTGNAASTIAFTVTPTEGVTVEPIAPVTLATAAGGGSTDAAKTDLEVRFRAAPAEGLVNRGDPITLKATPSAQQDPKLVGPVAQLGLRVNTVQVTEQSAEPNDSPAGGLVGALAALAVVAVASRRR